MSEKNGLSRRTADVCFVVPPFDRIKFPALGVSVLAAALRARDINVRVIYGSMLLAAQIGADAYNEHSNNSFSEMLGERIFVPFAYPPEALATLGAAAPRPKKWLPLLDDTTGTIPRFIETLTRQVLALRPKIVGFSSSFQQNMASIALARRIKQDAPDICVVIGGANVAAPMGDGLATVFPWIDHIFSGEADIAFPDFCERYLLEGTRPTTKVIHCPPLKDMRSAPAPDFSDYFHALRHFQKRGRLPSTLPSFLTMESSRGCWWGEKNHCTFCGLNADGMAFRMKPAERAFDEIRELTTKWGIKRLHFSDNILPRQYFESLLPRLADWPDRPDMFFEIKANLRDEDVRLLARAGISSIQPGIESFSSHSLKLMHKGVSALQNMALLRSARTYGVHVFWNYLYGFPGERAEEFEAALLVFPEVAHLCPPVRLCQLIVDRFSPYHFDHAKLGIGKIAPCASYNPLYPVDAPLMDIAYHFDGDHTTPVLEDANLLARMNGAIDSWKALWSKEPPRLQAQTSSSGKTVIVDSRRVARQSLTPLSSDALQALHYFSKPRPLAGKHDCHGDWIDEFLARHLLVEHENALMSVVTHLPPLESGEPALADLNLAARPARAVSPVSLTAH